MMMYKFCLTVMLSCFSIFALSQDKQVKKVAQAVEELRLALISGDRNALEKITASELSYGHSSGLVENQQQFIDKLVSGQSDFSKIELSDQVISVNKKLAIVRHSLKGETVDGGKTGQVNLKILLVWKKQKGDWKLVARQAVR